MTLKKITRLVRLFIIDNLVSTLFRTTPKQLLKKFKTYLSWHDFMIILIGNRIGKSMDLRSTSYIL